MCHSRNLNKPGNTCFQQPNKVSLSPSGKRYPALMPETASRMCDHRRNRHSQLFSPAHDPFSPLCRRFGYGTPSPSQSTRFPGFYRALPSSVFGHPPPARRNASFNHRAPSSIPRPSGASYREDPACSHRPCHLPAHRRDTRQPGPGRNMFPDIIPSIERGPSTLFTSPSLSTREGSQTSCSSPAPPSESLASRSYSHDGMVSPLEPRSRRLETPRYISALRPLSTSPSPGIPGEPPTALPLPTPSPPSCVVLPPGFRLGRQATGPDLRARVGAPEDPHVALGGPHRPRCPSCECVCVSIGNRSRRSGGWTGTSGPTIGGLGPRDQRRLR
ncbi:uncharacterized protein LY79DRAFT_542335 [Colletotrichum navitas]|uniref:Uncharacterized protein n=1 Tax=Colletotrichum navitas TaxID=681940 RepID=A0AAD8V9U3_9PEZI|nr:uncharacterized protein LY79DRAFT_542335 [Colletotrichum navitas]KAK1597156.1 hypothetical protein LY79DRAFT_542335 [Colletotrichum navitas]